MSTSRRWFTAQAHERRSWEQAMSRAEVGFDGDLARQRHHAHALLQRLQRLQLHRLVAADSRIIEIGSGPIGMCSFLPGDRVAVDPLMKDYERQPALLSRRDPHVRYRQGVGERLPCPSGHFDLAIIAHALDQVDDVAAVLREVGRVLKPDGALYLALDCSSTVGCWLHGLLAWLGADPAHLHSFSEAAALRLLERHSLRPHDVQRGGYRTAWQQQRPPGADGGRRHSGRGRYGLSVLALNAGLHSAPNPALDLEMAARRVA